MILEYHISNDRGNNNLFARLYTHPPIILSCFYDYGREQE